MGSSEGETSHQQAEEEAKDYEDWEAKERQEREAKYKEGVDLAARGPQPSSCPMTEQGFFQHMERVEQGRQADREHQTKFLSDLMDQNNERNRKGMPRGVSLGDFQQTNPNTFAIAPEPMDAEDWLRDTERKLKTVGCNDEEKVRYATFLLTGPAASGSENLVLVQPPDHIFTWEEFKEEFRKAHIPESIMELKRREFDTLQQNEMTMLKYVGEFNRLSRYAEEDVNTDAKRQKRFMKGLHPYMKMRLRLVKTTRFEELIDAAITLEDDYHEVQKERKRKTRLEPQCIQTQQSQPELTFHPIVRIITPNPPSETTTLEARVRCHNCATKGHFAKDCTQQDITCFLCGQLGHEKADCMDPDLARRSMVEVNQLSKDHAKLSSRKYKPRNGRKYRKRCNQIFNHFC